MPRLRWAVALSCALLRSPGPVPAAELPSPDAMALGARTVPRAIVDGYRAGIENDLIDGVAAGRVPAVQLPAVRARARAALSRILDEAFPAEVLAGLGAEFLASRYTADELRALRARAESPLGLKQLAFERRETEIAADSAAAEVRAREQRARDSFTDQDRGEMQAFAETPLGRKGIALAPELAGFFVDGLDRHWRAVRPAFEPRLRAAIQAALPRS